MSNSSQGRPDVILNSFNLLSIAIEACKRCQKAAGTDRRKPGGREGHVAIVFAAAFAEAFINEIVDFARSPDHPSPPVNLILVRLVDALEIARTCRARTADKYQIAKKILTASEYDVGKRPFQDFSLLMRARNWIMHMEPQFDVQDDLAKKFHSRNILSADYPTANPDFMAAIDTPAFAGWSVLSAYSIANDTIESLPECIFKTTWKEACCEAEKARDATVQL